MAKSGLKLHESAEDDKGESGCSRSFAETPGATLAAVCHRMTSANIAQQLQSLAPGYFTEGPILDKSGLKGVYDFKLEWITAVEANNGSDGPTFSTPCRSNSGSSWTAQRISGSSGHRSLRKGTHGKLTRKSVGQAIVVCGLPSHGR